MAFKITTNGQGGRTLSKTSRATTNDPRNKVIDFTIKGQVETFADITPSLVRFDGPVGTAMKQQILIFPNEERPFKVTGSKARDGKLIRFELKEAKDDSGRAGYMIEIENLKTDPGDYLDIIFLETNSNIKPTLEIRVFGNVREPLLLEDEKPDQLRDNNGTN